LRRSFLALVATGAVIIIIGLATLALWFQSELYRPYSSFPSQEIFLEIPRRANTGQIADLLVNSGILRHRLPFILYIRYKNLGRRIQAGEYRFADPATPVQVAQRLVRGDISFRSITIPEGLTAYETVELLAKNGLGDPEELEQLLFRTEWIHDLDPKARNLEGYLFPETYRFSHSVDSETVIKTMVGQFRKKISKVLHFIPRMPVGRYVVLLLLLP